MKRMKYASSDRNKIDSSWCINKVGICISFAIAIDVLSLEEIDEFGKQFMKTVKSTFGKFLDSYCYSKTDTPVISATNNGGLIMLWSFQAENNKNVVELLKECGIKQVKYD